MKEWVEGYWRTIEIRHFNGEEIKCYQICSSCEYGGNGAGCDEGDGMTTRTMPTSHQRNYDLVLNKKIIWK